jgi:hypothetical protein
VGKLERGALLFGLQETPIKLAMGNIDIVFIKSAKFFHMVENFTRNRKTMAFYAYSLIFFCILIYLRFDFVCIFINQNLWSFCYFKLTLT